MKKISIIVPVYNAENYINRCLNSLINQTMKDIEIIIVNDGSTDKSEEVIKPYLKCKNIKYIKKQNKGLSSSRNVGIENAKGEYIGFVDNDDYVDKNMFHDMYKMAKENNSDIVVCGTEIIDGKKSKICHPRINLTNNVKDYMLSQPTTWNKIYKRNLFDKDYKFSENLSIDDLDLIPCLILKTTKISYIDKPYYKYVMTNESITRKKEFDYKFLDIYKSLENIEKRFKKSNKYKEFKQEIEFLYIEHLLHGAGRKISKYKKEGKKYLKEFNKILKEKYPNWQKNKYLKKMSYKHKLVIFILRHNMIHIIRIINRIEGI